MHEIAMRSSFRELAMVILINAKIMHQSLYQKLTYIIKLILFNINSIYFNKSKTKITK